MGDQEQGLCDFCHEDKIVNRTYLRPSRYVKPKEGWQNLYNEGNYFIIVRTCNDCGVPSFGTTTNCSTSYLTR